MLDTSALSRLASPSAKASTKLTARIAEMLDAGQVQEVIVPEIADYELRRELIRAGKTKSIQKLDELEAQLEYLAITTPAMREAAQLWAAARTAGRPTGHDAALDGDVILAAQARSVGAEVWTTNAKHLGLFVTTFDIDTL
jgi:predicted nucleic acid-binding protein